MSTGSDPREAGNLDPVASARLSAFVEVEIEASRTTPRVLRNNSVCPDSYVQRTGLVCDPVGDAETQFPALCAADHFRAVAGCSEAHQAQPTANWALVAENLFLRKQLALYLERKVKPRRASDARLTLVFLSRLFAWRQALTIVERHMRRILQEWVTHYNRGRPHASLGPGIPERSEGIPAPRSSSHPIPCGHRVVGSSVLGGLHHEYRLEKIAA